MTIIVFDINHFFYVTALQILIYFQTVCHFLKADLTRTIQNDICRVFQTYTFPYRSFCSHNNLCICDDLFIYYCRVLENIPFLGRSI